MAVGGVSGHYAHKLARGCYHLLKEQKPLDIKRRFA